MNIIKTIYVLTLERDCPTVRWMEQYGFKDYVIIDKGNSLSIKRAALVTMQKKGHWVFMMQGNIDKVTGVDPKNSTLLYNPSRKTLSYNYSPKKLLQKINREIKYIEQDVDSCSLIGFASNENHFFRKSGYSFVGFVWGKMVVMKNSGFPWRHDLIGMEDYAFTAECLKHDGAVCINKWIYPHCKRPSKETAAGRLKEKLKACKVLVEQYKGLYRYNNKPNLPKNSEIQMRFHSLDQIKKWRMQFKTKNYQTT